MVDDSFCSLLIPVIDIGRTVAYHLFNLGIYACPIYMFSGSCHAFLYFQMSCMAFLEYFTVD